MFGVIKTCFVQWGVRFENDAQVEVVSIYVN